MIMGIKVEIHSNIYKDKMDKISLTYSILTCWIAIEIQSLINQIYYLYILKCSCTFKAPLEYDLFLRKFHVWLFNLFWMCPISIFGLWFWKDIIIFSFWSGILNSAFQIRFLPSISTYNPDSYTDVCNTEYIITNYVQNVYLLFTLQ